MTDTFYPKPSKALSDGRSALAPEIDAAVHRFSDVVFRDGALSRKTKLVIAVAVSHVTQCPYCIQGHTKGGVRDEATSEEIMEAIWVAAEMRAGGAFAHSLLALDALDAVRA